MKLVLTGADLYTPEEYFPGGTVVIEDGKITAVGPGELPGGSAFCVLKLNRELIISPGFLDLHTHGFGGYAVSADPMQLAGLSKTLAAQGITGFLATTFSSPLEELARIIMTAGKIQKEGLPGASLLGVHLEGPFLNPDYAGAYERDFIRQPASEELRFLLEKGPVSLLTLAPELPGALEVINEAATLGITVAAGHSGATYEETVAAVSAGLSYATHVFNRMAPLHHRAPGLPGAVLTHPQITVEAIADGIHLHPATLKILTSIKREKLVVASDTVACAGLSPGTYQLGSQTVTVTEKEVRSSRGCLAGSARPLSFAVFYLKRVTGLTFTQVLPFATTHPARVLGLDYKIGRLAPGYDADLAVFTQAGVPLLTLKQGRAVFRSPRLELPDLPP
ncbi:MAG: N-acetylglucosamine-6-phosphate deacetylase [Bacillota bacterium]|nr:N-acetylglucosamine-6-phosphate deacetylase [Bacillota bacterium]